MTKSLQVVLAALVILALAATGCDTTSGGLGSALKGDSDSPCNVAVGAIAGGVLGALVNSKDRGKGALIGAGIGALACVVINAVSKQTKPADQVEADYRNQHGGQLPPSDPVVEAYNVNIDPNGRVHPGDKVRVVSNMTVVRSKAQPIDEVKEVLTLSGSAGSKTLEKTATAQSGSGAYENTFNLTFPKDIEAGSYPVKTQLLINGKEAAERKQKLVVVSVGDTKQLALVNQ